ncbi:molybdopterin dehydrogenase FAD-binding protein [Desulfobulbus propionicus DSM 2032]|jgi:xanthine dehydrogenase FAD-binding subunit|uniref:Molybdopterin dehydrogenase FAD-binding protein n=1 Tax=Desulfobulbus propionicus (strain ATCC 33891 / DSM 2032 / VKM B-1956 / 1pr3) TaxID=577650 RepID=A0A7U3YPR5_DESPD|nr:xanthine dehydrogenase family protein subunit M [Desulfobulbus propionicus]ADW19293.1 molybdopterin dehydrogenase FAD-binding protein [Desulfobulbus propionicus DSM 2032]
MSAVLIPTCLDQALDLLAEHPDALPLAGGTDLLVRLRARDPGSAPPLLSLARIEQLQGVAEHSSFLAIGAATPFARILADPLVERHAPLVAQAARTIGGPAVRNMATIGGNIATASPAGDSLPPLCLHDARIELASPAGRRVLPLDAFLHGPGRTARQQGELITRILLPKAPPFSRERFVKVGRRRAHAISVTSFAGLARLDDEGVIADIRMAWGSVGPTVVRLPGLEAELVGVRVDRAPLGHIHQTVHQGVSPLSDLRASAEYRRLVAANLAVRFVEALGD